MDCENSGRQQGRHQQRWTSYLIQDISGLLGVDLISLGHLPIYKDYSASQ